MNSSALSMVVAALTFWVAGMAGCTAPIEKRITIRTYEFDIEPVPASRSFGDESGLSRRRSAAIAVPHAPPPTSRCQSTTYTPPASVNRIYASGSDRIAVAEDGFGSIARTAPEAAAHLRRAACLMSTGQFEPAIAAIRSAEDVASARRIAIPQAARMRMQVEVLGRLEAHSPERV